MEKNIYDALVCLFKAHICGDEEEAMDYVNEISLKWLRETLEKEGFVFDPFDEDNNVIEISDLVNGYLKEYNKVSKPNVRKYLSVWWFPFNEKEVDLVLTEVKKAQKKFKQEKEKINLVENDEFVKIKSRGDGIEKIYYALKVLAKHKLIELKNNSWACTIDNRVNINKIFGKYVPDIDTALVWYTEKDCEIVFPRLFDAMTKCGLEAEKEIKEMAKIDGKEL
jgi:hypothetical protein